MIAKRRYLGIQVIFSTKILFASQTVYVISDEILFRNLTRLYYKCRLIGLKRLDDLSTILSLLMVLNLVLDSVRCRLRYNGKPD